MGYAVTGGETSISVPGYRALVSIYESARSRVYRAFRESDSRPVVLKMLREDYPTADEVIRYKQEHVITRRLSRLPGVIGVFGLEDYRSTLMMVLEDFGADSLNILLGSREFSLRQLLEISCRIVEALGQIHAAHVIHKDINPSNIVYNPHTGELKIIDFGISTDLSRENPPATNPELVEGTPAYISPEQTGRMNRSTDYRTDYYSLGATLYKLFTGRLPFESRDMLDIVHCHMARRPTPPHEVCSEIPQVVSDIVMKLLSKNAEDRYQSSLGIRADVEKCLHHLQKAGRIHPFTLARKDVPERFHIPQKLYGRERQIELIMSSFESIRGGEKRITLVSGSPGIGKTSLIREIYKPVTEHRGYFISGKNDQFQQNTPYAALARAFSELVPQLLSEKEADLTLWRDRLAKAFGPNGQLMVNIVPELELIVGPQPPPREVGPVEAQNRFNLVFREFIRALCRRDRPMVLFLDDLQWADPASLKLLELMMTDNETRYLLVLGAYRDGEVGPRHLLSTTLQSLREQSVPVHEITVGPLEQRHVAELARAAFRKEDDVTAPLAELIHRKTGGNPFFINEFLTSLYREDLVCFESSDGGWRWDLNRIQACTITENVVDIPAGKMLKLNHDTQQLLKSAACIGNHFDLDTLALMCGKSGPETLRTLWEAVSNELIFPLGDAWKPIALDAADLGFGRKVEFKFSHDRIQQSAYSLIPAPDRPALHGKLGRLLLKHTPPAKLDERIFEIVDQLNQAGEQIGQESERLEAARLNLVAGMKAKASAALHPAYEYLRAGMALLGPDSWEKHYGLTLHLHSEVAEAAWLCTDFEQSDRLVSVVLGRARSILDKVKIYEVAILSSFARGNREEALGRALEALDLLGERFPRKATTVKVLMSVLRTKLLLAGKNIEDLNRLPHMTNPVKRAAIRVLLSAGSAAYGTDGNLLALLILRAVALSIKYGNSSESAYAYSGYGLLLCSALDDVDTGYKFGRLALDLLNDPGLGGDYRPRTSFVVNSLIRHWKEPARKPMESLLEIYAGALEAGDLEFAAHSAMAHCISSYCTGEPLRGLDEKITRFLLAAEQSRQFSQSHSLRICKQTVLNLMGRCASPYRLKGESYDEDQGLRVLRELNMRDTLFEHHFNKAVLSFLFAQYREAFDHALLAEECVDAQMGLFVVPTFFYYDALIRLALYNIVDRSGGMRLMKTVALRLKKLKRWAFHAPANQLHRVHLVEAERSRVLNKPDAAVAHYHQAIEAAHENGFIHEQALALELAGKFFIERGIPRNASGYIIEARYCYSRWGAKAKVAHVDETYADILALSRSLKRSVSSTSTATGEFGTTTESLSGLDVSSTAKAVQAISGEIILARLLDRLMKIVVQSAGAQRGFLILESGGELVIEAQVETDGEEVTVLQSVSVDSCSMLSPALISYVERTNRSLVLDDAAVEGEFVHDPYIVRNRPKSVLCAPLIHKGNLVGILYLENNLTTGAFTSRRVEMLQLMCSQAAVSLENARLYEEVEEYSRTLEQKVAERTEKIEEANRDLKKEIAEKELAREAFLHAKLTADQASRAKSDFLANMSHELRTPLNAIIGFSELLEDKLYGDLNENQMKFVNHVLESARHLLMLINEILDLSKVESGKMALHLSQMDLSQTMETSLLLIREKAINHSLKLDMDMADDLVGTQILADELRFKQMLFNLLSNAAKFTPDGGSIRLKVRKKGTDLVVSVSDTGIGIKPEDRDRIFEPFEQAGPSGGRGVVGTGLGLTLTSQLVELHGGRIWVSSAGEGQGSTFSFTIPLEPGLIRPSRGV